MNPRNRHDKRVDRQAKRTAISTEAIELAAFLKWAQVVETGGQAKRLIQSGQVAVNGGVERRRSRRLFSSDRVTVGAQTFEVIYKPAVRDAARRAAGRP